jgi:hypothetical protein
MKQPCRWTSCPFKNAIEDSDERVCGIQWLFGDFTTSSLNRRVSVKKIGEQHVVEYLGFIPSLSECLAGLKLEAWMSGAFANVAQRPPLAGAE